TYLAFATRSPAYFAVASFLVITVTSLAVGVLLNVVSPEAAGSGIPQLKAAYWQELGFVRLRAVVTKFVAGVLSIGGGNSLGREGPSVFIGGGAASTVDRLMGTPRKNLRGAAVIGAAAGLAAAFNTPLAAITFVIEEVVGDLNSRHLGRVVLAAVMGAFVVYALLGRQPAFILPPVAEVGWWHYLVVPLVALCAALAGVSFQYLALAWRGRLKRQRTVPAWSMPLAGGLVTWVLGVSVFLTTGHIGVFGLGYQDLSAALRNDLGWQVAGVLVLAKLLATIVGYSFGGCGGIFAPSLFIGGLSGYFLGGLARGWLPLTPADQVVLAAVGMSACLGAIIRAPLTSMLMVFEMTHQFAFVPGLMLGMIVSQAVARLAGRLNFYDALLVQDGHELHKIRPPLDMHGWRELPVSAIATPRLTTLDHLTEGAMRQVLERTPYQVFPVIRDGHLLGVVTRRQLKQALLCQEPPSILPVATCYPDQTIGEIGDKFLDSTANMLVVIDRGSGATVGLITLHDLIRAQAAVQQ
ncbi:MAG TPA: chloride channel protein, partial [Candidatus Aminicenantes bacterium]|nr:chloride channel protein [Candidatus Aminicenantes bacterium]